MNSTFESFRPEVLFSKENPFVKSAEKTHRLFAETFDKTARMQLAFGEALLDLNSKRFESLYSGDSVQDTLTTQQGLIVEAGQCAAVLADEFQHLVSDFQAGVTDAANDWVSVATVAVNDITGAVKPAKPGKAKKAA